MQVDRLNYLETFFPIAKITIVKTLIFISSLKGLFLHQLDVSNSYYEIGKCTKLHK